MTNKNKRLLSLVSSGLCGLFILMTTACKPIGASALKNQIGTGNKTQEEQCSPGVDCKNSFVDQTNYAACKQATGTHKLAGSYSHTRSYQAKTVTTTYKILVREEGPLITVSNVCSLAGEASSLTVSVNSGAALNPTSIDFASTQYANQQTRFADGKTLVCNVQIQKGRYTYSYVEKSNCISISSIGTKAHSIILVPN